MGWGRGGMAAKVAGAAALVGLGEVIVDGGGLGAILGAFALAWLAILLLTRPAVIRAKNARIAAIAAVGFGLVMIDDPNLLAWAMFWTALSLAALLPRRRFDDAVAWAGRLGWHALAGVPAPVKDAAQVALVRARSGRKSGGVRSLVALLALLVVGGTLFVALFAGANPLIGDLFARIVLPDAWTVAWRSSLAMVILLSVWASLRPSRRTTAIAGAARQDAIAAPDLAVATLALSLLTFNVIFAVENALDIIFLWSGAALPAGVTMADYAHRGAYSLIVTALLAGAFVLVALRPGSAGAASSAVRRLVTLWIAQNLLLVASSARRTLDYVDAYGMTVLRLSALAWMALVATGLALIGWRLLRDRLAAWLVNANALAATLVLAAASVVDLGATTAAWNVRVALERRPAGPPLDLCYMARLGSSSLVSLAVLERHVRQPGLQDRVAALRWQAQEKASVRQQDWRRWSGRDARRLATVRAMLGMTAPRLRPSPLGRDCGGSINTSPPAPAPAPAPERAPTTGTDGGRFAHDPGVDAGAPSMILCPMPRTILVVDDDPHIRQLLVFALDKAGLGAIEAGDGEQALALAAAQMPDLVVLDINMPRMDGLEVCRRLRAAGETPILFLSSRDDEIDRVLGIELGADDYVVKPFSPREVVARVMAILRRTSAHTPAVEDGRDLAHGRLRLDLAGWQALWDGHEVALTVTEFSILRLLASMPARVFSRDAIIDRLHGPGFAVTDRTIDSHIRNLRAKVARAGGGDLIETRPGIGYRLGTCAGEATDP